jgi:hypothetical protein
MVDYHNACICESTHFCGTEICEMWNRYAGYRMRWQEYILYLFAQMNDSTSAVAAVWHCWHHSSEKIKVPIDIPMEKLFL